MAKKITDKEIDNISKETGTALKDKDKVRIKIPNDPLNPKDTQVVVGINGFNYVIKKEQTEEVQEEFAKILDYAKYI